MVRAKTLQNCTESGECSITRMFDHSSRKARNFGNIETKGAIINSSPILIFSATMRTSLPSLAKVRILARESVNSSPILARQWWRHFRLCLSLSLYYRKRGSVSYIVREVHSVRERERERDTERERRKWRHHCRAKIGDEFCTSPCQKCAP